jgi:rhamnulokinase
MAVAIRHALHDGVRLSGRTVDVVHIVGGGVSNALFCQLVADACRLPVIAGPTEAASWGNAIYQARALGVVDGSVADARALIRRAAQPVPYAVRGDERAWQHADDLVLDARGARS